jgi:predicted amidohydrolase YtcJ
MSLLPGFVDAHCHLLAMAASLQGLDCGPEAVSTMEGLRRAVRRRAGETQQGRWVCGFGYDDLALAEGRHPTRLDLDRAAPGHPVRLDHRSGHATVLNSPGLRLAGIHRDTPDPVDGVIDRDEATGEPTGLLLEMGGFLGERLGRLRSDVELAEGIARLDRKLLSYGITSVQDAGPDNGLTRWDTFRDLQVSGGLRCRVTMLAGASHLDDFLKEGWCWGDGDEWLRLGHAKVMLTLTTGALQPDLDALRRLVHQAHQAGFPVAVHAVEREAIVAAARLFQEMPLGPPSTRAALSPPRSERGVVRGGTPATSTVRDRIEHCAECPPELVAQVRRSGATVVTQPGFIFWNGDRYRERVEPPLLGSLYPVGGLVRSGVCVSFGSDAPVIDPNPWPAIHSAVTRVTRSGREMCRGGRSGPTLQQEVSVESAIRMYTVAGAFAEGTQELKGTIRRGKLADLVLLDQDPTSVDPSSLKDIRPVLTVLGGRVVWQNGPVAGGG